MNTSNFISRRGVLAGGLAAAVTAAVAPQSLADDKGIGPASPARCLLVSTAPYSWPGPRTPGSHWSR
ncbi:MAG: hypothetical protein WKF76_05595 [Nocardioidaceae bacterium]